MIALAQYTLIILLSILLMVHLGVILKIIPYNLVWGGRLKTDVEMYRFEAVGILTTIFLLLVILIHAQLWKIEISKNIMTILLWMMSLLFFLNSIGNIISKNKTEKILFAPVTILMTILSAILALSK